ncbi:MAG: hypothetical protein LBG24_09440 [Treponema sp.]|jgi:uncharacterized membrane protein YraQ (UPF0718 family)|nr:hypothetical protein [Treponema sp.]
MNDIDAMSFHDNAKGELAKEVERYSLILLYESKIIAFNEDSDEVQSVHVKKASERLKKFQAINWKIELSKIIGGTLLGVFIPGFITSIVPLNIVALVLYTLSGLVGLSLVFIGIRN